MRAIIIHSDSRTIVEAEIDGKLKTLQSLVGGLITAVYGLPDNHHCYVDDEGLLKQPRAFFMFEGGHQPLAGNGVILRGRRSAAGVFRAELASCRLDLQWVKDHVRFLDPWETDL